jgi:hypothetical protein
MSCQTLYQASSKFLSHSAVQSLPQARMAGKINVRRRYRHAKGGTCSSHFQSMVFAIAHPTYWILRIFWLDMCQSLLPLLV